jgi:predicted RNase H-like HicB family nuclease
MDGRDMHYSMVIQWEPQGSIYVVTVPELSGCVTHGTTYEEAVRQGLDAIDSWVGAATDLGRPLPAPQTYSLDEVSA